MSISIPAIFEKGVFRPMSKVALTDGTRVQILIPEAEIKHEPRDVAAKLARIAASAKANGQADTTSQDVDAVLYDRKSHP
jgi:predicted DNA-binding antitoxin AbrB/MazE fold protein